MAKIDITNACNWNNQYQRDENDDEHYAKTIIQWMEQNLYEPRNLIRETIMTRYYVASSRTQYGISEFDTILCQDPYPYTREKIAKFTMHHIATVWLAYDKELFVKSALVSRPHARLAHKLCMNDDNVAIRQYIAKYADIDILDTLLDDPHEFVRWSTFDNPSLSHYQLHRLLHDDHPKIQEVAKEILDTRAKIRYTEFE